MLKVLILGAVVWSFFQPRVGSIVYLGIVGLLQGYLLMLNSTGKITPFASKELEEHEIAALKKYHLYFQYPFTARSLSSTMGLVVLGSFVLVAWLLYRGIWVQCVLTGISPFPAIWLGRRLNPRRYLHDAVERRGKVRLRSEMEGVDRICERVLEYERCEDSIEENQKETLGLETNDSSWTADLGGELAKLAFRIDGREADVLREAARKTGVPLKHITREYGHLRYLHVEEAIGSVATKFAGADEVIREFYKKSVFCLMAPELFAPWFVGICGADFWEEHEERRAAYNAASKLDFCHFA